RSDREEPCQTVPARAVTVFAPFHGIREGRGPGQVRIGRIEDFGHRLQGVVRHAPRARDNGYSQPARQATHTRRYLAPGGLPVDAPLAGDDELGTGNAALQAYDLAYDFKARTQGGLAKGDEARPQAARRAGARNVGYLNAQVAADNLRI